MHADLTTYDCVINIFPLFVQHLWKLVWPVDLNVFHVFRPVRSILEPRALLARGRIDEAIKHYELTLQSDPSPSARVYNNIGVAYSERGWTDRAIEAFRRSLEIRPEYARAHLGLGIAFYQKGWTEKAIGELRLAIMYDPYLVDAHHNLGVAYIKLGNRSEAEKAMRQASKLDPEYYKRPR